MKVSGSDVRLSIHTALRKCCDSTVTSVMWNLVHFDDEPTNSVWVLIGDLVVEQVNCGMDPGKALRRAADFIAHPRQQGAFSDELHERAVALYSNEPGHAVMVFHLLFSMFSDMDWAGAVGFLS